MVENNKLLKQFKSLCSNFQTSRDELLQFTKEYNIGCLHCKYTYNTGDKCCKRKFIYLDQDTLIPLCFKFTDN